MNNVIRIILLLTTLTGAAARKGGGGSRPSGGSKPSGSAPRPSPTYSSPSTPSKPSPTYSSPSTPSYSSPSRPTTVSSRNTNPVYKPVTLTGAPTLPNGGGGYSSTAKVAAAAAGGATVGVAAGTFLYGGRYSSPSCRGMYRYSSSYCPRGRSTTSHECREQIPLCPIPETVRERWHVGSYPNVEVLSDAATCSVSSDLSPLATSDSTADSKLTLDGCLERVVSEGTCTTSRFTMDEVSGKCGCCAAGADPTPLEDGDGEAYTSAVYSFSWSSPFEVHGPPTHCISGAKLHWPEKMSGNSSSTATNYSMGYMDSTMDCECGTCNTCGAPGTSYLDWSGPYAVPPALGSDGFVSSDDGTAPTYDPVDTCICNAGDPECYDYSSFSSATGRALAGSSTVLAVVGASALGFGCLPL